MAWELVIKRSRVMLWTPDNDEFVYKNSIEIFFLTGLAFILVNFSGNLIKWSRKPRPTLLV